MFGKVGNNVQYEVGEKDGSSNFLRTMCAASTNWEPAISAAVARTSMGRC